jgi:hypothetical protein
VVWKGSESPPVPGPRIPINISLTPRARVGWNMNVHNDEPKCCCWAVIDIMVKCNNSITCINSVRCVMNVHASYIYIKRYLYKFKN